MYNILICDDDKDIVSALRTYLMGEGYKTFETYNGVQALEAMGKHEIHLVIMDIMMPKMDGISTLARLRQDSNVPVILLTAKGEDNDKIIGLNLGADDYITKPFNPVEVAARIKSQLRRYMQLGCGIVKSSLLSIGPVEMDDKTKQVLVDGEEVNLTPKEYEILKLLMENPGQVFSPKDIYENVWGNTPFSTESTVAVHIRHLREKIEINPAEPKYLKMIWGRGYKIEPGEYR